MPEEGRGSVARVAVIGAGVAGLSAAKHLLARGADVTVFEAGSTVGGLWVYENDSGRSPAYRSLHINTPPDVTHYHDFPFRPGTPLFPSHREIHAYLESYADHFDVRRHIRFSSVVQSVRPSDNARRGRWTVRVAGSGEESFDDVVVATGHQSSPAHPPFARDFAGEYLHSHAYRIPEPFRGKRVLVVGAGNSALDIAADICTHTEKTIVAVRSPVLIMPRTLFGVPTQYVLARITKPFVPWIVQRAVRRAIARIVHGPMEHVGLVTPKKRTHPASHPTFMAHVVYGRIELRPGVERVEGTTVHFGDGRQDDVDTMITATGYDIDLPFLSEKLSPVEGRSVNLYRRVVHPDQPGLYFIGFFDVSGGANIRMMDVQADWVAALVAGEAGLPRPAAMHADIARVRRRAAKRYPGSPRYGLELDPQPYVRLIARELRRRPRVVAPAERKEPVPSSM